VHERIQQVIRGGDHQGISQDLTPEIRLAGPFQLKGRIWIQGGGSFWALLQSGPDPFAMLQAGASMIETDPFLPEHAGQPLAHGVGGHLRRERPDQTVQAFELPTPQKPEESGFGLPPAAWRSHQPPPERSLLQFLLIVEPVPSGGQGASQSLFGIRWPVGEDGFQLSLREREGEQRAVLPRAGLLSEDAAGRFICCLEVGEERHVTGAEARLLFH
jgi:hypothetical protein